MCIHRGDNRETNTFQFAFSNIILKLWLQRRIRDWCKFFLSPSELNVKENTVKQFTPVKSNHKITNFLTFLKNLISLNIYYTNNCKITSFTPSISTYFPQPQKVNSSIFENFTAFFLIVLFLHTFLGSILGAIFCFPVSLRIDYGKLVKELILSKCEMFGGFCCCGQYPCNMWELEIRCQVPSFWAWYQNRKGGTKLNNFNQNQRTQIDNRNRQ